MNDDSSSATTVEDGHLGPKTFLQTLFDVREWCAPQLFRAAFPDNDAGFQNFFRFAHGKAASDDKLCHALLFAGAGDTQNHLRMTGGQLVGFDESLDFNWKLQEPDNVRNR